MDSQEHSGAPPEKSVVLANSDNDNFDDISDKISNYSFDDKNDVSVVVHQEKLPESEIVNDANNNMEDYFSSSPVRSRAAAKKTRYRFYEEDDDDYIVNDTASADSLSEDVDASSDADFICKGKSSRKRSKKSFKKQIHQHQQPLQNLVINNNFKKKSRKFKFCDSTSNSDEHDEDEDDYNSSDVLSYVYEGSQDDDNFVSSVKNRIDKVIAIIHKNQLPANIKLNTPMYLLFLSDQEEKVSINSEVEQPNKSSDLVALIKWENQSHLHCTVEEISSLSDKPNFHKIDIFKSNSLKKTNSVVTQNFSIVDFIEPLLELETIVSIQPEELLDDLITSFDDLNKLSEINFFCKWRNLDHSDCSYETFTLIKTYFPEKITQFIRKVNSSYYPHPLTNSGSFIRFKKNEATPDFITNTNVNLTLRDYQLHGLNWLVSNFCRNNSVILADEMGLGKTVQVISFLSTLFHDYNISGPFIVIVPLSTINAWASHFEEWAPDLVVNIYHASSSCRAIQQEHCFFNSACDKYTFNVVITTYEILLKDQDFFCQIPYMCMIIDEAQRLKSDKTMLYNTLKSFKSRHRLLMTGTPLQNNLRELWCILHFILPEKFYSWFEFERNFSELDANNSYAELQREISPFFLRRVKKDVEKSLPPKIEQILRVDMTPRQKHIYRLILTKNYTQLSKELKASISGYTNVMMELKKCCNHGLLVDPEQLICLYEDKTLTNEQVYCELLRGSGKLVLLDQLLDRFYDNKSRILIFSQMTLILDILEKFLQLKNFSYQRLDGSKSSSARKKAITEFNDPSSNDFVFLLSTRAGGLGLNLATADVVIIFDSDWNPQNDLQAQARAHRIGQKKTVKIYRLVTKNSVDESVVERAKRKLVLDHLVIQTMNANNNFKIETEKGGGDKNDLIQIIKFGAEALFSNIEENLEENTDSLKKKLDLDQILKVAETDADNANNPNSANSANELLSAFKIADFSAVDMLNENDNNKLWDEIIPRQMIDQMKEEEETQKLKELYLPPRVKNATYNSRKGDDKKDHSYKDDSSINKIKVKIFKNVNNTNFLVRKIMNNAKCYVEPRKKIDLIVEDFFAENTERFDKEEKEVTKIFRDFLNELFVKLDKTKKKIDSTNKSKLIEELKMITVNKHVTFDCIDYMKSLTTHYNNLIAYFKIVESEEHFFELLAKNQLTINLPKGLPKFVLASDEKVDDEFTWVTPKNDAMLMFGVHMYGEVSGYGKLLRNQNYFKDKIVDNIKVIKRLKKRFAFLLSKISGFSCAIKTESEEKPEKETKKKKAKKSTTTKIKKKKAVTQVELSEKEFNVCKEIMKSEKEQFTVLERLFKNVTEDEADELLEKKDEQLVACLQKLSKKVEAAVKEDKSQFKDAGQMRSALWTFISRFTRFFPERLAGLV